MDSDDFEYGERFEDYLGAEDHEEECKKEENPKNKNKEKKNENENEENMKKGKESKGKRKNAKNTNNNKIEEGYSNVEDDAMKDDEEGQKLQDCA